MSRSLRNLCSRCFPLSINLHLSYKDGIYVLKDAVTENVICYTRNVCICGIFARDCKEVFSPHIYLLRFLYKQMPTVMEIKIKIQGVLHGWLTEVIGQFYCEGFCRPDAKNNALPFALSTATQKHY